MRERFSNSLPNKGESQPEQGRGERRWRRLWHTIVAEERQGHVVQAVELRDAERALVSSSGGVRGEMESSRPFV